MAPNNPLPCWGNEKTMNLNHLILTNIQSSPYFKVNLFELKTYHEVIDEIYYKVAHLEPWEKGSRKTAGQTGMCGGVRGVGAGGIVSSAYCLLYKLYTLKLTKKQVIGLITHQDSPYIRALGLMYIRYTQSPADLWDWYEEYLTDEEELDVKAGGGETMTIGEIARAWLTKIEWYSTLFPRIPVPIQRDLEMKLKKFDAEHGPPAVTASKAAEQEPASAPSRGEIMRIPENEPYFGEAERIAKLRKRSSSPDKHGSRSPRPGSNRPSPPFDIAKEIEKEKDRQTTERDRGHNRRHRSRSRSRERPKPHSKKRSRSHDRHRSRSRDRKRHRSRDKEKVRSDPDKHKSGRHRSRSRDRKVPHKREHRSRSREKRKSHSPKRKRSRSRDRNKDSRKDKKSHGGERESSFERDLRREKERQKRRTENGD